MRPCLINLLSPLITLHDSIAFKIITALSAITTITTAIITITYYYNLRLLPSLTIITLQHGT